MLAQQLVTVEMKVADERDVVTPCLGEATSRMGATAAAAPRSCWTVTRTSSEPARARRFDLLHGRAFDVRCVRIRHRLHDDGRIASDADRGDGYLNRTSGGWEVT